jgi:hypothetical protein
LNSDRNVCPSACSVEGVADLDRQVGDLGHDRLKRGDQGEHALPAAWGLELAGAALRSVT